MTPNVTVRFFIYSPGRAGSTAIANELSGTETVICFQEPFVKIDRLTPERREISVREYRKNGICRNDAYAIAKENERRDIYGYGIVSLADPTMNAARYLDLLESHEAHSDKSAVGFKAVKGQIDGVPDLWKELARRQYIALCLTRRNYVKGALSAAIAQQKGLYNTNDPARVESFRRDRVNVPLPVVANFIREYRRARWAAPWSLRFRGMRTVKICYEDFLSDRMAFYRQVFTAIGVDFELPPPSSIQKLVPPDLADFIENYDEVAAFLKRRLLSGKLHAP